MQFFKLYENDGRYIGIIFPELFKMIIGIWLLYVIFDWAHSPYAPADSKQFNITILWDP
jgi:hypothetical protein